MKASNKPHKTSSFEFRGGPVLLISEDFSSNTHDGAVRAVRLFLVERGSKNAGETVGTFR